MKAMLPDVTGFTLGEAFEILKAAGVNDVNVRLTAPPREVHARYTEASRVVRLSTDKENGIVELIVCNMNI